MLEIILDYVPALMTGVIGFAVKAISVYIKYGKIPAMITKIGGKEVWSPVAEKLVNEVTSTSIKCVQSAIKAQMASPETNNETMRAAAIHNAKTEIKRAGQNISDSALNALMEVMFQKIKAETPKK